MSSNIREFELQVDRAVAESEKRFTQFKAQVAADGASGVISKSPVDTGFLVNSWTVSAGDVTLGAGAVASSDNQSLSESEAESLRQSNASAARGAAQVAARAADVITIANGANYAVFIEEGAAGRSPQPMVAPTLAELRSKYRRVR